MTQGLVFGFRLDTQGGGTEVATLDALPDGAGDAWLHVDVTDPRGTDWLRTRLGMDPLAIDALTADETRPRATIIGDGMFVVLRGVNLNPGEDPEDMVSLRLWIDEKRMISARRRRVQAVNEQRVALQEGRGATDASVILTSLVRGLSIRMGKVLGDYEDEVDALEEEAIDADARQVRAKLSKLRRTAIALRRHLAPQRDALNQLAIIDLPWFSPRDRAHIRESADQVTRYVEGLDEIRERCAVMQDELMNRQSEDMNSTMFLLSIVAAITLPLGLLTGLLGINVGGMPGVDNDQAFNAVLIAMVAIVLFEVWIFRRLKWI